jgi:sugar phosphate isomerase/epimerase
MHRLGSKLIRIMSYAIRKDGEQAMADQLEEERFSRLRRIVKRLLEEGITPVHENCMNYGGMSWAHTLKLIENVPGLKLVFDTGNPIFNNDFSIEGNPKQNAWEFYQHVKQHVAYIHIKDGKFTNCDMHYSLPGQGDGYVEQILTDLLASGYDGGISIEPHLGVVFHDDNQDVDEDYCYHAYIEYGRALEAIVNRITLPSS